MTYLFRLGTCSFVVAAVLSVILFLSVPSKGLEDILYEDLTCEELLFGYNFNIEILQDMLNYYDGCIDYVDVTLDGHAYGALSCQLIKEHAMFVQGTVNDIAAVFNIKCADG